MLNSLPPNLMNWLEDKAVLVVLELMLSVSDERLRALSLSLLSVSGGRQNDRRRLYALPDGHF